MSLSVQAIGPAGQVQSAKSTAANPVGEPSQAPAAYGSTPAATLTISAQARALAIKSGHDPDGIQDGK